MLKILFCTIVGTLANLCPLIGLRSWLYRRTGVRIGKGVFIGQGVLLDKVHPEAIEIGDRTAIGARSIITAHQIIPTETDLRALYPEKVFPTVIEHDVWIMCHRTH